MSSTDPTPEPTENEPVGIPSPAQSDTAELAAAKSLEPKPAKSSIAQVVLPQPGLFVAVALTTLPLFAQVIVGIGLMLAVCFVYAIVTARPLEAMHFVNDLQVILVPVGTFVTLLVAVAVCWMFFGRTMGRKVAWRGVSMGQLICVLALTVPLAVLASEVTNCVGALLEQFEVDWLTTMRETGGALFQDFVVLPAWLVFLGGCLLPGLGEEIYCRGLISRGLVARYGVVAGTLFAAGLFGAMHLEPVQAIGAFALGIGLQFVYLTTRSLIAPIVLHTLNNSFAFLTMRFADSYPIPGLTPMPDGSAPHTPITVLAAAVLAGAILAAIMYQNRTRWQMPDGEDWSPGYVTAEMPDVSVNAVAVRESVHPMLVLGAAVAIGLFVASIVAAHLAVAVSS